MATGRRTKRGSKLQNVWTLDDLNRNLVNAKENLKVAEAEKVQDKYIKSFQIEVETLLKKIDEHTNKN